MTNDLNVSSNSGTKYLTVADFYLDYFGLPSEAQWSKFRSAFRAVIDSTLICFIINTVIVICTKQINKFKSKNQV